MTGIARTGAAARRSWLTHLEALVGPATTATIAGRQPDNAPLFALYVAMELDSTFSFQAGPKGWLADKVPHLLTGLQLDQLAQAKADADHRRALEASLPARHRYVDGWPIYVPDHAEAVAIGAVRAELLARHQLPNRYPDAAAVIDRFAELLDLAAARRERRAA